MFALATKTKPQPTCDLDDELKPSPYAPWSDLLTPSCLVNDVAWLSVRVFAARHGKGFESPLLVTSAYKISTGKEPDTLALLDDFNEIMDEDTPEREKHYFASLPSWLVLFLSSAS